MKLQHLLMPAFILFSFQMEAQLPNLKLRILDSLPEKMRADSGRIILRSELDSLIKLYVPAENQEIKPQYENTSLLQWAGAGMLALLILSGIMMYAIFQQKRMIKEILRHPEKQKTAGGEIELLSEELHNLAKENEGLQAVIKEYNGIHQDYDSLRQSIQKAYKVKKYPGNEKEKKESDTLKTVIDTEKAVANNAYEKFLKPLLVIADANKNNPAMMDEKEREKVLDLIISLSFWYIEYLYLRVNDLSVGGSIVDRVKALAGGKMIQPSSLMVLNRQSGSRALVVKMALDKAAINSLAYPVFDETNLNNQ